MTIIHPQYITSSSGEQLVALPVSEFNNILEELEELDDIRSYDEAKKADDGERVLFSDYLKTRKDKHA